MLTFPNAAADTLAAAYFVDALGTYTLDYALSAAAPDNNPKTT